MGSLRRFDIGRIRTAVGIDELVETGSGRGDSLALARAAGISQCWSVELHSELARHAQRRFAADPAVTVVMGDSRDFLARLPPSQRPRLFFLDAHFAGGADFGLADYAVSAGHEASFPLLDELGVLLPRLAAQDLVIADDARMYFDGSFQNGECPEFARRWHERDRLIEMLAGVAATHERVLFYDDEGYLVLSPKHLAKEVPTWLQGPAYDRNAESFDRTDWTGAVTELVSAQTRDTTLIELTPQALFDASVAALQNGRIAQARAGFEALRGNPMLRADALHLLGVAAGVEGNHTLAAAWFREAVAVDRTRPEFHSNLALALERSGQSDAARASRNDVGVALHVAGRYREAVAVFEQILAVVPNHVAALVDAAASLHELAEHRRALHCAIRVLHWARHREPQIAAFLDRLRIELAEICAQAMPIPPTPAPVFDGEEALPLLAKALNNCANSLLRLGHVALAEDGYAAAHALAPDEAIVRWNLSHVRLLRGDFERGFALYESRWQWSGFNFPDRHLPQPRWDGQPAAGQRLLVYAEQGFGDTIQFARFVAELAARGARVWFEVQQELFWLMKQALRSEPQVEVIPRMGDPRGVYGAPAYDAHCGVMSLARQLGIRLADLPGRCPYLAPDAEAVARWASLLGPRDRPRVGLVWAGRPDHARDRERSVSLAEMSDLLAIQGIDWVSLQLGAPRLQIAATGGRPRDLGGELRDFHETAALIGNLDLLITVDTAAAHLAGAMGKPVWILLPHVPDWRWLLERDDSPWYPSARLFRQREGADWAHVMREVQTELLARFGLDSPNPAAAERDSHEARTCKVCGHTSDRLGVVDFAKNCLDPLGARTRLSGVAVEYFRCSNCALLFTPAFDHWDKPRFVREIYNDEYSRVDPDYVDARPRANAQLIASLLRGKDDLRILDYGSGNDRFAQLLRAEGFDCASWDPLRETGKPAHARGSFDLVTAFEVFEHSPTPLETFAEAVSFLKENGALIFSTLIVDPAWGIDHWYVAPRNGHVTLYSRQALAEMAGRAGLTVRHINDGLHVAWQQEPAWLDLEGTRQPCALGIS